MVTFRGAAGRFAIDPFDTSAAAGARASITNLTAQKMAQQSINGIFIGATVGIREVVEGAVAATSGAIAEDLSLFAESLRNNTRRNRDSRVTRINATAAELAQEVMMDAYRSSRVNPSYGGEARSPTREPKGALEKALGSPQFYTVRWDGVLFGNAAFLYANAKQWYRLNFGAGGAGRSTTGGTVAGGFGEGRSFPVKILGREGARISLNGNKPRGDFKIPPGMWMSGETLSAAAGRDRMGGASPTGKGDHFVVNPYWRKSSDLTADLASGALGRGEKIVTHSIGDAKNIPGNNGRITKGIAAQRFIDAGVQVLARELGRGWTLLWREWLTEAAATGQGPIAWRIDLLGGGSDVPRALRRMDREFGAMRDTLETYESPLRL
jgi:hypothetical protein